MLPLRGVSTAYRILPKFGRAGNLPNVIPHAKFNSVDIKLWIWRRFEVLCFRTTTADVLNTAKPCRAACDT